MKPISVQLYSLRGEAQKDFDAVLQRVADIGYKGVEPAGFYDFTPAEFRARVEDLGMVVSSSHGPWVSPDNIPEVIDTVGILGLDIAGGGYGPNDFKDMDAIKRTADTVNGILGKLKAADIDLIIATSSSPEHIFPATASIIQDRIGATNAGAFDILAACTGFIFALNMAAQSLFLTPKDVRNTLRFFV